MTDAKASMRTAWFVIAVLVAVGIGLIIAVVVLFVVVNVVSANRHGDAEDRRVAETIAFVGVAGVVVLTAVWSVAVGLAVWLGRRRRRMDQPRSGLRVRSDR